MQDLLSQQVPDLNSIDFRKINVDEITDDQIIQMMDAAESNGYTIDEIEAAALARGMSQTELQKLRLRMNTISTVGKREGTPTAGYTRKEPELSKRNDLKPEDIIAPLFGAFADTTKEKEDPRKKIFGYSLFNSRDLTFEPNVNMPTPDNYILGPGDEVIIDIWGNSQQNYREEISPDGFIFLNNLGRLYISGFTIREASDKIIQRLTSLYSGLSGTKPNTFAQVSLGQLRSIKVILMGDVYLPGTYTLSSLSTAFNALYLSGGPDSTGSLRNIEILRNNRVIDTIDVYNFLFRGDMTDNIHLNDQDIIKVNPYGIRVQIAGEIKKPLIYEMKPGETLADLFDFAGGFSEKAFSSRVKIIRNNEREKEILDVSSSQFGNFNLKNGDSIIIDPVLNRYSNRVEIKGAVYRPGEYSLDEDLTLKTLISKAGGLKGDAFMSRALIYRTQENLMLEAIPVDLQLLLSDSIPDIRMQREDVVTIPSIYEMREEYYVQIDGEIKNPGRYPYLINSTVEDVILQAGGLLESASLAQLEVARRVRDAGATTASNSVAEIFYYQISKDLRLTDEAKKLRLEPFDRIFVRHSPGYEQQLTVSVEGEVQFPGEYSISNNDERISDLLKRSGGLTRDAYPKGASLIRQFEVPERERTKAVQSSEIFRSSFLQSIQEQQDNNDYDNNNVNRTDVWDSNKLRVLDSILTSAVSYNYEQTIGINLEKIIANPYSKYDLIIQEGDRLLIPKLLQTVSLTGELLHPSSARFDTKSGFRDYIRSAGGFTTNANKSKPYIIYANGSIDNTRNFLFIKKYPKIEPGAEIVVPLKERRPVSAGEIVSIGSALTSMALLIVTLINSL